MDVGDKDRATLYCGNLGSSVTEELLYELFLQVCCGILTNDIVHVTLP